MTEPGQLFSPDSILDQYETCLGLFIVFPQNIKLFVFFNSTVLLKLLSTFSEKSCCFVQRMCLNILHHTWALDKKVIKDTNQTCCKIKMLLFLQLRTPQLQNSVKNWHRRRIFFYQRTRYFMFILALEVLQLPVT